MAWVTLELGILLAAAALQGVYRFTYERLANGTLSSGSSAVEEVPDQDRSKKLTETNDEAESAAAKARLETKEQLERAVRQSGGTLSGGDSEHLRGFPGDPQASFPAWGEAYEQHLACSRNASYSGIWAARVRHYSVDPVSGESWGFSITGAELLAVGRHVIFHGGWDDQTAARDAVFSADVEEIIRTGRLAPVEVTVSFRKGLNRASCPGPAYGHTVTSLGGDDFLVVGGVRLGGYRGLLDHWGTFRLHRGGAGWRLQWLRCGRSEFAARAWHTATLVPVPVSADAPYVLLCGGSGVQVPAAVFKPATGRFSALPKMHMACMRAGHSAARAGGEVLILGGTDHLGAGMPWQGDDLQDIHVYDAAAQVPRSVPQKELAPLPAGLLARQHSSVLVAPGTLLVLAGGLGGLGAGHAALLNFTALRSGRPWARLLPTAPLPAECGRLEPVPSALVPPLRGQAVAWTGSEAVVFGGAVMEREGYHGMLLLRVL